jgi:hypothetical protein
MNWLDRLERRLGRFGVPQVTLALIICQVLVYLLTQSQPEVAERLFLFPDRVAEGEWWRVFTFLIVPPYANLVFAFFIWYFFYLMGTTLEYQWGTFRYNIFLLIGYMASVGASFAGWKIWPEWDKPATNAFLEGSVFLAFAYLYPDFVIYIFFILPVRIKWLALLAWIGYGYSILFGSIPARVMTIASICNFLLFFGSDILHRMGYGRRQMEAQFRAFRDRDKPFHRCMVCGITDKTNPQMDFRYCSQCEGSCGYCTEHLKNHEHRVGTGQDRA